jgi:hypothetical protein
MKLADAFMRLVKQFQQLQGRQLVARLPSKCIRARAGRRAGKLDFVVTFYDYSYLRKGLISRWYFSFFQTSCASARTAVETRLVAIN